MFHGKDTISGSELMTRWEINTHYLSYLIMKHDLTVIEPDTEQTSQTKLLRRPRNSRIATENLLEIITDKPGSLCQKIFLLSEVERIAGEIEPRPIPKSATIEFLEPIPKGSAEDATGVASLLKSASVHALKLTGGN